VVPTSLPLAEIRPNPNQPREVFQDDKLEELAASIRAHGIIQPVVVRKQGAGYQIIAGERRWRAAKLAELNEVPIVIQEVTDEQLLEVALIENIQREDLNPIETAQAFERLSKELGLSHEEIGRRTGKDRATIANLIRLLRLPAIVQKMLEEQKLQMGHARALLALPSPDAQVELAGKAIKGGWSVRQVEREVQNILASEEGKPEKAAKKLDPNVRAAMEELERSLGTRVRIVTGPGGKKGRIEIEYYSPEELDRLYGLLVPEER
jgi:ParB family chromosome partitioning protein